MSAALSEIMAVSVIGTPAGDTGTNATISNKHCNRLWVGVAGTVTIVSNDLAATTYQFSNVIAGRWHNMPPFQRVNLTGTAATGIVVGVTF